MKLSVVIPVRNVAATIGQQLTSLSMQDWPEAWEVIVVDNGSTDETKEVVESYRGSLPELRVVDAGDRTGPGFARNLGIEAARADSIAFTDGDDIAATEWVAAMGAALERVPVVGGRLEFDRLNTADSLRMSGRVQESGLQVAWYPPFLPHASGCNLGVRREALDAVGGFDEGLPCLTDADLCFRLQAAGYGLAFAPDAVVHYRWRSSARGAFRQARSWARVNTMLSSRYRSPEEWGHGSWRAHGRQWLGLLRRLPKLRNPLRRGQVIRPLGTQLGLLEGALRYGVAPMDPSAEVPSEKVTPIPIVEISTPGPPRQAYFERVTR